MGVSARVLVDSTSPAGTRLRTVVATFPRIILAEVNTHRAFARNSASSRAIPVEKMLARVKEDPFVPLHFGKNQAGMQAGLELEGMARTKAETVWLRARDQAVDSAEKMLETGVHKQIANRLLEPFLWHTAIISATDWANFFAQRAPEGEEIDLSFGAQPEMQALAITLRRALRESKPTEVSAGTWSLPLFGFENGGHHDDWRDAEDFASLAGRNEIEIAKRVSVARAARVSYMTFDGRRDMSKDLELYDRLSRDRHWSPFEHVAAAAMTPVRSGPFSGWIQFRKFHAQENVPG